MKFVELLREVHNLVRGHSCVPQRSQGGCFATFVKNQFQKQLPLLGVSEEDDIKNLDDQNASHSKEAKRELLEATSSQV